MKTICTLPQSMVNKIAAGEVIERPASVVKELVENSLDAGSTRIDIHIEQGGSDLICIADNGEGINADQLVLAVSPHSTSKIADADDLFKILTFGFRGEALASVAEISQMSLKSRTASSNAGAEIRINGGQQSNITPCGLPVGTRIEVRNLCFNAPVRRKYWKSTVTEFGHVTETFVRLALPQPTVHFTLTHNGKTVHDLPPVDAENRVARIRQLFGEDVAKHLIYVESRKNSPVQVRGFVSHPNVSRNNNRMQYFFLNNRFIRDKSLQHALLEAYRGILTVGRFPLAFLQIELPPDSFDVNVHPTKMEVRWLDSNRVYSGFLGAIREKFLETDLNGRVDGGWGREGTAVAPPMPVDVTDPRSAMDDTAVENTKREVMNWLEQTRQESTPPSETGFLPKPAGLSLHTLPERAAIHVPATRSAPPTIKNDKTINYGEEKKEFSSKCCQLHQRYIVTETENGIGIIDQHALHERILYEKLKTRIEGGPLDSQRLLVPLPVDLSPVEFACVSENQEFFRTLGLTVEPFGGETVLVSAVPSVLSENPPQETLLSVLEPLLTMGKKQSTAELLDELLHGMACKAAVKAGEHLHPDSAHKLIELAKEERNAHHCPHGRPSMLVLTVEELDKMFKRT